MSEFQHNFQYSLGKIYNIDILRPLVLGFISDVFKEESGKTDNLFREGGNSKVLIIGLPKSGNVWLASLLSKILHLEPVDIVDDYNKEGIIFQHIPVGENFFLFRKDIKRAVYLLRDIRDIIVSFYHYAKTEEFIKISKPPKIYEDIDSFYFEYFVPVIVKLYDWSNHPDRFRSLGVPVVKYEDLYRSPFNILEDLMRKWGINPSISEIEKAVEDCSIQKMREGSGPYKRFSGSHYRIGGSGGYKNELTESVLDDVNERFNNFMGKWNYC